MYHVSEETYEIIANSYIWKKTMTRICLIIFLKF